MAKSSVTLADGATLVVQIEGDGPDLVLVSGLSGTAVFWDPVVARLAERFRIIRFDQRATGASSRGTAPVSIDLLAQDTLAVLDHVDSKRPLLVGHSTGGVILQAMAAMQPARVPGLILSGTWLKPNRYMTELFTSRLAVLRAAPREYAAMTAFGVVPPDWLNANWRMFEAMCAAAPLLPEQQQRTAERIEAILRYDRSAEARQLDMPKLVLGAVDDAIVPAFLQRELAAALPRASTHVFAGGGHFFPITRAEEFCRTLLAWAQTPAD